MTNIVTVYGDIYVKETDVIDRIMYSHNIVPVLKRADELFMRINPVLTKNLDCILEKNGIIFEVSLTKDRRIKVIQSCITDEGYMYSHNFFNINYEVIESSTNIGVTNFCYSPLHNNFTICDQTSYLVPRPFIHDEGWYFQKLTLRNLLPESWYIHGSALMQKLMEIDSNFVYLRTESSHLNDEVLIHITELLDLLESKYA